MAFSREQRKVIAIIILGTWFFGAIAPHAFAEDPVSTSFQARNSLTDTFGGTSTSTGFSSVLSGGQTVAGEATSTNFILSQGSLYFELFQPLSQNWRWYDDENNETPTSALAAENTAPIDVQDLNVVKLRVAVAEMSEIGVSNAKLRLQFGTTSDFSSGGYNVDEEVSCLGGSQWCYANGGGADNALITTALLSDSDPCVASAGDGCGTHNEVGTSTSSFTHSASTTREYEFTVQQSGALLNTVYYFRLVDVVGSSTVPLNTGESYPSLVTGGTSLMFTIDGLNVNTTTEGVTTDITTTSTAIPFGTLSINSTTTAAQRLTVTTNASSGYKIYAYQRQAFLSGNGDPIDPISGTNASPVGWNLGCPGGNPGCYGYHSGEDILDGGSTRFAADDTYAQFTNELSEVAYNAGPANNKVTDIVYQVEVRNLQENGDYSTNVVYIVTPVF